MYAMIHYTNNLHMTSSTEHFQEHLTSFGKAERIQK